VEQAFGPIVVSAVLGPPRYGGKDNRWLKPAGGFISR
jgi:hypothetical protein